MNDYTKNITRWIYGLTKDQFDEFIKVFIKDYFKVDTVSFTDGKSDGGIDMKIFINRIAKKIPLQVTVDSNVYNKLEKDLVKIFNNIQKHQFSENFYFFYSKGASEEKVNNLQDIAKREYSISLEIFDNKLIATYLEKPDFAASRNKLRDILGEFLNHEKTYFTENDKLCFDLLNHNSDSLELKERFINAFVLNAFFNCSNTILSKSDIQEQLKNEFNLQNPEYYCNKIIDNLLVKHKIEKVDLYKYQLTENESNKLKSIKADSDLLEREFLTNLQSIINNYDGNIELKIIIDKIYNIFKKYKEIDLDEINEAYEQENGENIEIQDLISYVNESLTDKTQIKNFIYEVISLCSENDFIIKISAGKLYKDLINSSEFDSYTRRQNKEVFLDTPVLLNLLMVMKEEDFEYDNYRFKVTKSLFSLIKNKENNTIYNTIEPYVIELADYLNRTIKMIPIYDTGLLEKLGGTSNELLNFFLKVKEKKLFDGSFRSYIEDFGISLNMVQKDDKNDYLQQFLIQLLKVNEINIDVVHKYDTDYKTRSDFQRISKTLGEIYSRNESNRKARSLKFDSLLFMHIYDLDIDLIDPIVITWDNTFKEFRKEYQLRNPSLRYWHLFKPGKYLDHTSLLNFKINSSAISNEILSMIDTEFEVVRGVKKLSDILTSIIDLKSASGTKLSRGLAEIRDTYIYEINKEDSIKTEVEYSDSQPVDEIVSNIYDYYNRKEGSYSLDNFTSILQIEDAIPAILLLLGEESSFFMRHGKYSDNYKKKFDGVIKSYLVVE
ncbi:hypothetical protein [Flavobacterium hungaricum]|uniref:Uncharacterized protein n=1 Tax=Flavobacterium hungaricum TaxID=2082725 RepID=A0ABR9TSD4_9FLAO|nr:hypothetical protein [Flavobacterium hungaricum]MBE8728280.1 hypothetical protein [Flavobacterium hungaricum]